MLITFKNLTGQTLAAVVFLMLIVPIQVDAAKYAGEAFSLGVGARPLALGGATVAGPFDGTAPYWNPAGMNSLSGRSLTAMHAETFGSLINHDFISYVSATKDSTALLQSVGFYLYYLGGGGIKITQLNEFDRPYVVREESHGDYLLAAAVAGKPSAKLDLGLSAKIVYRDIGTESGWGLTMDAGLTYRLRSNLQLGLAVTDFTTGFIRYSGRTFDSGANAESIYPTVKPGFMFVHQYRDFTGRFLVSGDVRFESIKSAAQFWSGPISVDTHWGWEIGFRNILFGRAGFDIGRFTAGGGVDIKKLTIDFAYLHHAELDETFRVSAGYRF